MLCAISLLPILTDTTEQRTRHSCITDSFACRKNIPSYRNRSWSYHTALRKANRTLHYHKSPTPSCPEGHPPARCKRYQMMPTFLQMSKISGTKSRSQHPRMKRKNKLKMKSKLVILSLEVEGARVPVMLPLTVTRRERADQHRNTRLPTLVN